MDNRELSLEEIHQEILTVFKKIVDICDQININYFIAYGTLIGAVRHKGFIPWDDDLDIQMTRPEFEKFVSYCEQNTEILYPYKLISFKNTPDYPYEIPRFCDTRFRMEKGGLADAGMGIFVDIYPLDGIGDDIKAAKKKIMPKKRYWQTCWSFWRDNKFIPSQKGTLRNIPRFFAFLLSRLHNLRYYLIKLHSISTFYSYENSKFIECITWNELFRPQPKEWYSSYDILDFEHLKVKAPKNYDKVLKSIYGNYMQLPPIEKQKPSHSYKIFKR
jgi:lipopolysaccharide cholinephosphotransferase